MGAGDWLKMAAYKKCDSPKCGHVDTPDKFKTVHIQVRREQDHETFSINQRVDLCDACVAALAEQFLPPKPKKEEKV